APAAPRRHRVREEPTTAGADRRRLELLCTVLNLGVLWLGPGGELEFASTTARTLLGCERDEDLRLRWPGLQALIAGAAGAEDAQARVVELPGKGAARSLRLECHGKEHAGRLVLVKDRRAVDGLETDLLLASQMRSQSYA